MLADQRYCLECGERRAVMSSVLLGGPPLRSEAEPGASASPPARPPDSAIAHPGSDERARGNALAVIAGVGVLLLAMGVGVLIGRSSATNKTPATQVITVGSVPAAASAGATGSGEAAKASFTSDWPSGTSGYTVQLQTLPQSGTQVSAVEAAKTAASAKGAKNVGALKSEEFSSLGGTNYVVYSGVYHKRAEAQNALKGLRKSFSAAAVIKVSNGGASSSSSEASTPSEQGGASHHSGVGYSLSKPAPPTVVKKESTKKGQGYEQESKSLPNVISTG
jgi:hypothetical protein